MAHFEARLAEERTRLHELLARLAAKLSDDAERALAVLDARLATLRASPDGDTKPIDPSDHDGMPPRPYLN